jgi:hypothetical protein
MRQPHVQYLLSPSNSFVSTSHSKAIPQLHTHATGLFMISSYFIFWYYVSHFLKSSDDPPPDGSFLFNAGFAMLIYQTHLSRQTLPRLAMRLLLTLAWSCDAMPSLDLATDHCCCIWYRPTTIKVFCMTMGPFFAQVLYCHVEEYHNKELILPIVNDRMWCLAAVESLTMAYFYGYEFSEYWCQPILSVVLFATTVSHTWFGSHGSQKSMWILSKKLLSTGM